MHVIFDTHMRKGCETCHKKWSQKLRTRFVVFGAKPNDIIADNITQHWTPQGGIVLSSE
jgi:hypothetical protein